MKMSKLLKRAAALLLVLVMIAGFAIGAAAEKDMAANEQTAKLDMSYLKAAGKGSDYGYFTIENGPDGYSAAAFQNEATQDTALFLGTNNGVQAWSGEAGTQMEHMAGSEGTVFAIGGSSVDNMAALSKVKTVVGSGMDQSWYYNFYVYNYNAGADTWERAANSEFGKITESGGTNYDLPYGLVMGQDDIWLSETHWNGSKWIENNQIFAGFVKTGANTACGVTADGQLYTYNAKSSQWTRSTLTGLPADISIKYVTGTTDGTMLLATGGYYDSDRMVYRAGGDIYLVKGSRAEKLRELDENQMRATVGIGLDYEGTPYWMLSGDGYSKVGTAGYTSTKLYRLIDGEWVYHSVPEYNDPREAKDGEYAGLGNEGKIRPNDVRSTVNPIGGVTVFLGRAGANYILCDDVTVTFNTQGGDAVPQARASIRSALALPIAKKEGSTFTGWYTDQSCTVPYGFARMPSVNMTLYAGWKQSAADSAATDRQSALASLDASMAKRNEADYGKKEWMLVEAFYQKGKYDIAIAEGSGSVYYALNSAIANMDRVTVSVVKPITVCVSVEKFTLGQGYLIEPTLVTVDNYAQASSVIVKLINQKYADLGTEDAKLKMTGTVEDSFYLASIYDPNHGTPTIPEYILKGAEADGRIINAAAGTKDWLGEFDYSNMSGWMYSVDGEFPGVGAAGWRLSDGEVMRWQFTLHGYGSDLGADNSAWGAENITNVGNKGALTWAVAEMNGAYSDTILADTPSYTRAITVLQNLEATQAEVDQALTDLKNSGPRMKDVPASHPYANAVNSMLRNGLMKGTAPTLFDPNGTLSRGMAATVLHRLAGSPQIAGPSYVERPTDAWPYLDTAIDAFYGMPARWIKDQQLLQGEQSVFCPNDAISQSDLEKLILGYCKLDNSNAVSKDLSAYFSNGVISRGAFAALVMEID